MKKETARQVHRPAVARRPGKERDRPKDKETDLEKDRKGRQNVRESSVTRGVKSRQGRNPKLESPNDPKKSERIRRPPVICVAARRGHLAEEKGALPDDDAGQLVFDSDESSETAVSAGIDSGKAVLDPNLVPAAPVDPRTALKQRLTQVIERKGSTMTVSAELVSPQDPPINVPGSLSSVEADSVKPSQKPFTQVTKRVITLDEAPLHLAGIRKNMAISHPCSVEGQLIDIPVRRRIITTSGQIVVAPATMSIANDHPRGGFGSAVDASTVIKSGKTVNDDLLRQSLDVLLEQDPDQTADREELTARLEYKRDILQQKLKSLVANPESVGDRGKLQGEYDAVNHLILELHEAQRQEGLQQMQVTREHQDAIVKKVKLTKEHFQAKIDLTADSDEDLGEDEQLSIMVNGRKLFEKMKDYKKPPKDLKNPFDKKSGGRGNKALPSDILNSIEQKFRI